MPEVTQLAFAQLTATDRLVVQLLRLENMPAAERTLHPAAVRVLWPPKPTVVSTDQFPELAAVAARLFAGAATELAHLKSWKWPR